mmetsp:Transcript_28407/g.44323  ORF Transcript_28407/g.44323 Transcript_28407/m.44323 type:complete len:187 (-) Transcript_28407:2052-2612(-)
MDVTREPGIADVIAADGNISEVQKSARNGCHSSEILTVQLPADMKVDEDDPVVVINWRPTQVMSFLQNLQNAAPGHNRPGWLQVNQHGGIDNPEDFQRMMAMRLAEFGGGCHGDSIIGPNTQAQFCNIIGEIFIFQQSSWAQAVAAANHVQAPLGKVYFVTGNGDKSRPVPAELHAPGNGSLQLFD